MKKVLMLILMLCSVMTAFVSCDSGGGAEKAPVGQGTGGSNTEENNPADNNPVENTPVDNNQIKNINISYNKDKIYLRWDNVEHAETYNIYKSIDGENYTFLSNVEKTMFTTYYQDTQITLNKKQYYKIKVVNSGNEDEEDSYVSIYIDIKDFTPAEIPTMLGTKEIKFDLSFMNNISNITGYIIEKMLNENNKFVYKEIIRGPKNDREYIDNDTVIEKDYFYKFSLYNEHGQSNMLFAKGHKCKYQADQYEEDGTEENAQVIELSSGSVVQDHTLGYKDIDYFKIVNNTGANKKLLRITFSNVDFNQLLPNGYPEGIEIWTGQTLHHFISPERSSIYSMTTHLNVNLDVGATYMIEVHGNQSDYHNITGTSKEYTISFELDDNYVDPI